MERLKEQMLDEVEDDEFDPTEEHTFEEPVAEKGFDAEDIPGHADGDWPDWPQGNMEHWVPQEVQNEFGSMKPTAVSGDFLQLDPLDEDESCPPCESTAMIASGTRIWCGKPAVTVLHETGAGRKEGIPHATAFATQTSPILTRWYDVSVIMGIGRSGLDFASVGE